MMFSLRPIFLFQTVLLFFAIRTANNGYQFLLSQDSFPFFQTIFHLGLVLIGGISGCLQFLGTQVDFKDTSCTSQGCFWFTGLVPRLTFHKLSDNFSVSISADISFYSVIFPSNQVAYLAAHITHITKYPVDNSIFIKRIDRIKKYINITEMLDSYQSTVNSVSFKLLYIDVSHILPST